MSIILKRATAALMAAVFLFSGSVFSFAEDTKLSLCTDFCGDISVDDPHFDAEQSFSHSTTAFDYDLAYVSSLIATGSTFHKGNIDVCRNLIAGLGFPLEDVVAHSPAEGAPQYAALYFTAEKEIQRNDKTTKLLLVDISDTCFSRDAAATIDFLNVESGNTDMDPDKILMFTQAAEGLFEDIKDKVSAIAKQYDDYIVWVTGWSRGGSVGNYLSKLLIDSFGTSHVTSYLFAVSNIDKAAVNDSSSRYYSIFNIINADDIVTYIPLRSWGFGRWGVDIQYYLPNGTKSTLQNQVKTVFSNYVQNSDVNEFVSIPKDYAFYDDDDNNGAAIQEFLDVLDDSIQSVGDYYTKEITLIDNGKGLTVKKIPYKFFRSIVSLVYGEDSAAFDELNELLTIIFGLIASSGDADDMFKLVVKLLGDAKSVVMKYISGSELAGAIVAFLFDHVFKIRLDLTPDVISAAVEAFGSSSEIPEEVMDCVHVELREMIVNYLAESYLAWMGVMSNNPAHGNYIDPKFYISDYDELPHVAGRNMLTCDLGVALIKSPDNSIFDDQQFSVSSVSGTYGWEYNFSCKYTDGSVCKPYNMMSVDLNPSKLKGDETVVFVKPNGTVLYPKCLVSGNVITVWLDDFNGKLYVSKAVELPVAKALTYAGIEQSAFEENSLYTVTSGSGIDAKQYTAEIALKDTLRYHWSDNTVENKTVSWSIEKYPLHISVENMVIGSDEQPHGACDNPQYRATELISGHAIDCVNFSGTKSAIGSYQGLICVENVVIKDENGNDVSDDYDITHTAGNLTITKPFISVALEYQDGSSEIKKLFTDGTKIPENINLFIASYDDCGRYTGGEFVTEKETEYYEPDFVCGENVRFFVLDANSNPVAFFE